MSQYTQTHIENMFHWYNQQKQTWTEAVFRHALLLSVWNKDFDRGPLPFPSTPAPAKDTRTQTQLLFHTGQISHQSGQRLNDSIRELIKASISLWCNNTAKTWRKCLFKVWKCVWTHYKRALTYMDIFQLFNLHLKAAPEQKFSPFSTKTTFWQLLTYIYKKL